MAKQQRLTLQGVVDKIFMEPLSTEDHLEEDYSDSAEYLPELDEEVPNEVTDTRNEPVRSKFQFSLNLCGGCDHIPGSFALLLCHFLNIRII